MDAALYFLSGKILGRYWSCKKTTASEIRRAQNGKEIACNILKNNYDPGLVRDNNPALHKRDEIFDL